MYTEIGAFDAKTRLSEILREVSQGKCFTITLRGQVVADLVPSGTSQQKSVGAAINRMRQIHRVKAADTLQFTHLMEEVAE